MSCYASLFYNKAVFQKSVRSFYDQAVIDAKIVLTFEICPLGADLKLKVSHNRQFFMLSISALPPEGGFQMSMYFFFCTQIFTILNVIKPCFTLFIGAPQQKSLISDKIMVRFFGAVVFFSWREGRFYEICVPFFPKS